MKEALYNKESVNYIIKEMKKEIEILNNIKKPDHPIKREKKYWEDPYLRTLDLERLIVNFNYKLFNYL